MWFSMVAIRIFKTYSKKVFKATLFIQVWWDHNFPSQKTVWCLCSVLVWTFWYCNHGVLWFVVCGSLTIRKTCGTFLWICTESWFRYQFYSRPSNGWTKYEQKISAFIVGILTPWKNNFSVPFILCTTHPGKVLLPLGLMLMSSPLTFISYSDYLQVVQ